MDNKGQLNHVLLMHVYPSTQVHANQADEVYLRVGDKSKKLNFEQRLQLLYAKGARFFEDTPVPDAAIEDLDLDFVKEYIDKIGYGKTPLEYLCGNKDFISTRNGTEQISSAAILLFGKNPQCQIKMFDDHMIVESPGKLPGLVRTSNIREMHFSRNPKIIEFLHVYEYVKEFGEGVDRMYREMECAGLPAPEYQISSFMLCATLKNPKWVLDHPKAPQVTHQVEPTVEEKLLEFCSIPRSRAEILDFLKLSDRKNLKTRYLQPLLISGKLKMTIPDKPNSRLQKYIKA